MCVYMYWCVYMCVCTCVYVCVCVHAHACVCTFFHSTFIMNKYFSLIKGCLFEDFIKRFTASPCQPPSLHDDPVDPPPMNVVPFPPLVPLPIIQTNIFPPYSPPGPVLQSVPIAITTPFSEGLASSHSLPVTIQPSTSASPPSNNEMGKMFGNITFLVYLFYHKQQTIDDIQQLASAKAVNDTVSE